MARAAISAIHLGELPFHVPMAVFITRDIGSFGSWRGGVLLQSATFSAEFVVALSSLLAAIGDVKIEDVWAVIEDVWAVTEDVWAVTAAEARVVRLTEA